MPHDTEALVISIGDVLTTMPNLGQIAAEVLVSSPVQSETHGERVISKAKGLASHAAARLRVEFPNWSVSSEVLTGPPAESLIEKADTSNASLLIVGSHGRSAIGRLLLGSVSKKLATDSPCAVRVARERPHNSYERPLRLVIGVDGSPAAEEAIYTVGHRVWPDGTEVRLISVDEGGYPVSIVHRLPQAANMIKSYLQNRKARVSAMLDWGRSELENIGLKASVQKKKGDPTKILLAEASKCNADCIFVGTREFSNAFERFQLGSVSTAVVTNAPCSVEVVRPPLYKSTHSPLRLWQPDLSSREAPIYVEAT